jgi:hypothetical protein
MLKNSLPEKLSESVVNSFKKTEAFEKIKFKFYTSSFLMISSIMGLTYIYMNYSYYNELYSTKNLIQESKNILNYNIKINRKKNLIEYCEIKSEIITLKKHLSELIENQKIIIMHLEEVKLLKNNDDNKLICRPDCISEVSFSPIKQPDLVIECKLDTEEDKDQEYDELLNECYDLIPLNNIKKNTALSWLF